ncbi:hypothetical protein KY360_03735 [Candidatus Woesearchaeota archaeon]|nr:hypothetical protein [Candidatus Woesearchaeota archaeon]
MNRAIAIAVVLAVLLVAGGVVVSANLLQEDKADVCGVEAPPPQPVCGSATCNRQCGGTCGIPSCGCGR